MTPNEIYKAMIFAYSMSEDAKALELAKMFLESKSKDKSKRKDAQHVIARLSAIIVQGVTGNA